MISIALLGFGCVGSGVAEVLTENRKLIESKLGCEYEVKYILDLRDFPESPFGELVTHDFSTILNDRDVSIVAEMMGGLHPAYDFTKACLEAGKNVVTSNKEVVATFGAELCEIASRNKVRYLFEASVGGGIPIIRPMMADLASNRINKISGILNGTTNFILTEMCKDGMSFKDALGQAQSFGYAEANPAADIEGKDAARKTAILGAIASGKLIPPEEIHTEGIIGISCDDVEIAETLGYSIKLIGYAENRDGKLLTFVAPMAVPMTNPLARIDGVYNGILVSANMVGEVMFYGPGAGKLPTASAVVADMVDIMEKRGIPVTPISWERAGNDDVADFNFFTCRRLVIVDGEREDALVVLNGRSAYFTDDITEAEAHTIDAVAMYRVL